MDIIFGPILSRRFGVSLGVDVSPSTKQCNFDCVYCELEAKKPMDSQQHIVPVKDIVEALKEALQKHNDINVLTFTANGEPTLYPHLEELIVRAKEILKPYPQIKTLLLSNGSLFSTKQSTLNHFDIVKFSLDSALLQQFKRVDKPSKTLNLEQIKEGIKAFAKQYKGELVAEVLLVKGINDDLESNAHTAAFLREIQPSRVDISSIDRPSSHRVFPISNEKLYALSEIYSGLNVCVVTRKADSLAITQQDLDEHGIIALLKRRPLTHNDCGILLTKETYRKLQNMQQNGTIKTKNIAGTLFYCTQ